MEHGATAKCVTPGFRNRDLSPVGAIDGMDSNSGSVFYRPSRAQVIGCRVQGFRTSLALRAPPLATL